EGFVVSETNGRWGQAIEVPGLGTLNTRGLAEVVSVSCGTAGNCAAGGFYFAPTLQPVVVSEHDGSWRNAIQGPPPLPGGGQPCSVSCGSAGNRGAAGSHYAALCRSEGFVVSEQNGRWGAAIAVPGLGTLNAGGLAQLFSVSCASAGNCAAGGFY